MVKLALLLLFLPVLLYAQPDTLWTWTSDREGPGEFNSIWQTADGDFIVGGYGPPPNRMNYDIWFHKLNASGVPQWNRLIDRGINESCDAFVPTPDGGYLLAGSSWFTDEPAFEFLILKTDAQGDTLWSRTYGHTDWDREWRISGMTAVSGGGYVLIGSTVNTSNNDYNLFLMQIAENGDSLWSHSYGGPGWDGGNDILSVDGGFVMVGFRSHNGGQGASCWLLRANAEGDTLWTRTYHRDGAYWNNGIRIRRTADDGYILCGLFSSPNYEPADAWLIRINENGDTLWTRSLEGPTDQTFQDVQPTFDGGFITAGYDSTDWLMVKYDSSGNLLWTKAVDMGGSMSMLSCVRQTPDSGFIAVGKNYPSDAGYATGFVVKTAPDIILTAEPDDLGQELPQSHLLLTAFPNPFNASSTLSFSLSHASQVSLTIFNVLGQAVYENDLGMLNAGEHHHLFDAADLPSGVYLARVSAGEHSQIRKMVLLK